VRVIIVQGVAAILDGFEAGGNDIQWPRGISPRGPSRTVREPLDSYGSHGENLTALPFPEDSYANQSSVADWLARGTPSACLTLWPVTPRR